MVIRDDDSATVARLESRICRLEQILAERSRLLRYLARELSDEDLVTFSRASCGLPPLPRAGFGLRGWRETTALSSGDVDRTMEELWRTLRPPSDIEEDDAAPDGRHGKLRA